MIIAAARAESVRVLAREVDRPRMPAGVDVVSDAEFVAEVDGIIALGGDGTMLGAMRLMIDRPVPVLGVNHGGLGFLVEVTPAELPSALARLATGEFTIEHYGCLEIGADGVELATRFGFNDVVLGRRSRGAAVSADLGVNEFQYGYYHGDAIVVSTPTGSTAYSYAAGGPIVSHFADAIVITPVAPTSGINRSVVLGADENVALTVAATSPPIAVDVDGTMAGELTPGDRLTATMRREAAQVVRLSAKEFATRSWVKLSLLDLPLRPGQVLDLIPPELRRGADAAAGGPTSADRSDR